jgi:hypothetical protein
MTLASWGAHNLLYKMVKSKTVKKAVLNNPNSQGAVNLTVDLKKKKARRKVAVRRRLEGKETGTVLDKKTFGVSGLTVPSRLSYLAALVSPRECMGARLPDPFLREATATYQSKLIFNVSGVSGTIVDLTPDAGRFSYVFNPILSTLTTFNALNNHYQVSYKDGRDDLKAWDNPFTAAAAGNFNNYIQDPQVGMFATTAGNGLAMKVRPVSMSVLASYNGNLINGGGNIAIALLPGGTWGRDLANTDANANKFARWESLATVPGAYDGPLAKGAYAYWLPDDETDYLFRTPMGGVDDNMGIHDYPTIVLSGIVSPDAGGNRGANVLRLDVYINYEYTTDSRVVETLHGSKSFEERITAVAALSTQPTSMMNDEHIDWIKVLLGGAAGFFIGGPLGAAAGAAAGAGISLTGLLK